MNEVFNFIGNVGFPIGVAVYLLVRIEQKLDTLTTAINNLTLQIKK